MRDMIFRDRVHAGQCLADELTKYGGVDDVIVLGLPRGGVPVAYEVAKRIQAPLDVLIVRKLGVPGYEELAMGAIASGGVRVMNPGVVRAFGVTQEAIEQTASEQLNELRRRELAYRGHSGLPIITGKIVILVDDGIATGSTVRAAVEAIGHQKPQKIVIATPTASQDARAMLEPMVEEFIAVMLPEDFRAVGQWYEDFAQTTDAEVTQVLAEAAKSLRRMESTI
jgi:putative phosphoribosyl transferase